jgi:hypothetical protein
VLTGTHAATEITLHRHAPPTLHVRTSTEGGWELRIERRGEAPVIEHYSDWHRLERRRAILVLTDCARVGAGPDAATGLP